MENLRIPLAKVPGMLPLGRMDRSLTSRMMEDDPGCEASQAYPKLLERFEISAPKVKSLILECTRG